MTLKKHAAIPSPVLTSGLCFLHSCVRDSLWMVNRDHYMHLENFNVPQMFAFPQDSYAEALIPNMMVFGGGVFRRKLRLDEFMRVKAAR